jgi:LysR family hydrogen peroxide-inducible transcriptional activator
MYTPTLRQLEYLLAIAETGQFSAAARRCAVSQPALSRQVKEVEEGLSVVCFERRRSGTLVTPEGAVLLAHARRVLAESRALTEAAAALGDPLRGRLRLGAIPTIAPYLLPTLLPKIRVSMPNLELELFEGMTEELRGRLGDGRLDLALVALPYPAAGLAEAALLVEPFALAAPTGHPLDTPGPATLDEVLAHRLLLLSQGHCLRDHVMQACRLTEGAAVQATSMTTLLLMVQSGLGATLVPAAAITPMPGVVFRAFASPAPSRQLGLWWRAGAPRLTAIQRIAALVSQSIDDLPVPPPMPGPSPRLIARRA